MVNVGSACIGCVDLTTYDPNAQINTFNGTWDWLTRISGTYIFPWSISSSVNYENRSNTAWARQVSFAAPAGQPIPSILLNVEPIGTERLPSTNLMSLRFEKVIPVKKGHKLMLRVNMYNALNTNNALSVQQRSGATFGNALTIVPPRIAELGLAYTF